MPKKKEEPEEPPVVKFQKELHSVFLRWWEESDLDEKDMGWAALQVVDEFCQTGIEFEADFDLDDD